GYGLETEVRAALGVVGRGAGPGRSMGLLHGLLIVHHYPARDALRTGRMATNPGPWTGRMKVFTNLTDLRHIMDGIKSTPVRQDPDFCPERLGSRPVFPTYPLTSYEHYHTRCRR